MRPKHSGFTLIELMIVVVLIAIIATVAVPGFTSMIESNRFKGATNNVIGLLNFARSEAVRKGQYVVVGPNGSGWQEGMLVYQEGENPSAPGFVPLRLLEEMPGSVTLELASGSPPRFTGTGKQHSFGVSEFRLCPGNGEPGVLIVVNGGGQTFRRETPASCP